MAPPRGAHSSRTASAASGARPKATSTPKRAGARIAWKPKTNRCERGVQRADAVGPERQRRSRPPPRPPSPPRGRASVRQPRHAPTSGQGREHEAREQLLLGARRRRGAPVPGRSSPVVPVEHVPGRHAEVAGRRRVVLRRLVEVAREPLAALDLPVGPDERRDEHDADDRGERRRGGRSTLRHRPTPVIISDTAATARPTAPTTPQYTEEMACRAATTPSNTASRRRRPATTRCRKRNASGRK